MFFLNFVIDEVEKDGLERGFIYLVYLWENDLRLLIREGN